MSDRTKGGPYAGLMRDGPAFVSRRALDLHRPLDWKPSASAATASAIRYAGMCSIGIVAAGERVTAVGYDVRAPEVHGLQSLPDQVRAAGVIYGAICEELAAPGAPSGLGVQIHGGRWGGGNAVDRRLVMAALLDRAHLCLDLQPAMEPQRTARKADGEMIGRGRRHVSRGACGHVIDDRRPISARAMIDMLCIDGLSFRDVLRAHGWQEAAGTRARLSVHAGAVLQALADEWNGDERGVAGA